jgi:peptide/nickel transport system substrate-binding protein
MLKHLRVAAAGLSLIAVSAMPALSQGTLRIGMTAADIPQTTGQPDQGFEGFRFAGYTIYDALVNWDLSKADTIADIKPGLATEWAPVEGDPKRWVFKLRQGVKFHDGSDFDADVVIWNLEKILNDKSPQFDPKQAAQSLCLPKTSSASIDDVGRLRSDVASGRDTKSLTLVNDN